MNKVSIAYLGPRGSFSEEASHEFAQKFQFDYQLKEYLNFKEIMQAFLKDQVDFAVLPIENSLAGTVQENIELLWQYGKDINIIAEWVLPIRHNLLGFNADISQCKYIKAHPISFQQCDNFISQLLMPTIIKQDYFSNSLAVEALAALSDTDQMYTLAIAPKICSKIYNIPVLKENIHDNDNNVTRFWFLQKKSQNIPPSSVTSPRLNTIAFRIPLDQPGGLSTILEPLASAGINLTKIISIPTKGNLCEYTFLIDFIDREGLFTDIKADVLSHCAEYVLWQDYIILSPTDNRF